MQESEPTHRDKIMRGLAKAAAHGRKPGRPPKVTDEQIRAAIPLGTVRGAKRVKLSVASFIRRRRLIEEGQSNG